MQRTRVLLHSRLGWRRLATGTYIIGRSDECDIVIRNDRTSRRHAELHVTDCSAWVVDLGSINGTYVNGTLIDVRQELQNQDFVGIGTGALEVVVEPDVGASPMEILRPKSTIPPPGESASEVTIGTSSGEGSQRAVEIWADGLLAAARSGRLDDVRTRRSAMQFGVQHATDPPAARWVDFVVELASLGVPLPVEHARLLSVAIEQVGAEAAFVEAYLARLRSLPPSPEQQALRAQVEVWQANTRRGWY